MIMKQTPINIYLPEGVDTAGFPTSLSGDFPPSMDYKLESAWMFYLMLKEQGMEVQICRAYPKTGLFLIHKGYTKKFIWNPGLFVVSMQWDYKRDDRGQVHLVANEYKTTIASLEWLDRITFPGLQYFVQPPMHSKITQRNSNRGDRFESVAFIGASKNLDPAFRTSEFREKVEDLGMKFSIVDDPEKMSDFSTIDVVIAIRMLGGTIDHKPPQKLVNAWRAGVPSILGREVGFQELHDSDIDYLEVDSVNDVINALKRLQHDAAFRAEMIENGLKKAEHYSVEALQGRWAELFKNHILPAYHEWEKESQSHRYIFLFVRSLRHIIRGGISWIAHGLLAIKPQY